MTVVNDGASTVTAEEVTAEEGRALFEQACQRELGVSADEFLRAYDSDDLGKWPAREVQRVEFLLPFIGR